MLELGRVPTMQTGGEADKNIAVCLPSSVTAKKRGARDSNIVVNVEN